MEKHVLFSSSTVGMGERFLQGSTGGMGKYSSQKPGHGGDGKYFSAEVPMGGVIIMKPRVPSKFTNLLFFQVFMHVQESSVAARFSDV